MGRILPVATHFLFHFMALLCAKVTPAWRWGPHGLDVDRGPSIGAGHGQREDTMGTGDSPSWTQWGYPKSPPATIGVLGLSYP